MRHQYGHGTHHLKGTLFSDIPDKQRSLCGLEVLGGPAQLAHQALLQVMRAAVHNLAHWDMDLQLPRMVQAALPGLSAHDAAPRLTLHITVDLCFFHHQHH